MTTANRKKYSFVDFAMMNTTQVFDTFANLNGAEYISANNGHINKRRFVFIRGTKKNAALMVAHADTVWDDKNIDVAFDEKRLTYYSRTKSGIGADCRAGCALLWHLRETGNSILLLDGEETGCIGARYLMESEDWRTVLNEHAFAIEFDRMHASDLVYYGVATAEFQKWLPKQLTKFKNTHGMWTDICVLCNSDLHRADCLDGVNISVGYYHQHSSHEILVLPEWQRTLKECQKFLSRKDFPEFKHAYQPITYTKKSRIGFSSELAGYNTRGGIDDKPYDMVFEKDIVPRDAEHKISDKFSLVKELATNMLLCPHCEGLIEVEDCLEATGCPLCQKEVV